MRSGDVLNRINRKDTILGASTEYSIDCCGTPNLERFQYILFLVILLHLVHLWNYFLLYHNLMYYM